MKSCSNPTCANVNPQPLSNFNKNKKGRNGLYCHCKQCQRITNKNRFMTPEGRRKGWKRSLTKYWPGSTPEQAYSKYMLLWEAQKGLCAICGKPETEKDHKYKVLKMLAVDHCHTTGLVRGLLCGKCNRGIGQLNDDPVLCDSAAKYLKKPLK